ncbi:MAG: hypothetical protein JXD19_07690 [Deltaproteobacteria bacterium]|nr:hypothetical protein [Deltaproteobacteria bacterium]
MEQQTVAEHVSLSTEKLCEECGQKQVISHGSRLCASCMAKRSRKPKPETEAPKKCRHDKSAKPEKVPKQSASVVTIDFGKYVAILKQVEKLADEEMRPVDLQVIYILKNYFKSKTPQIA